MKNFCALQVATVRGRQRRLRDAIIAGIETRSLHPGRFFRLGLEALFPPLAEELRDPHSKRVEQAKGDDNNKLLCIKLDAKTW